MKYEVIIERKNIKNMYMRIKDQKIYVTCPMNLPDYEIYRFLDKKKAWINKAINRNNIESKLIFDDYIYYLGKKYHLVKTTGKKTFKIEGDTVYLSCLNDDYLSVFYEANKKYLLKIVVDLQDKYLKILKDYGYYQEPQYNIKYLKSMWGCCYSKRNIINLSVRLIHFDKRHIEAVLWHELLHFIIPNHSKRFHEILALYLPDYEKIIKEIR